MLRWVAVVAAGLALMAGTPMVWSSSASVRGVESAAAPVIAEGRVARVESSGDAGDPVVFVFEVDEVLNGFLPGGSILVRLPPAVRGPVRAFRDHVSPVPGTRLQVVLEERDEGGYDLLGGFRMRPESETEPATPELIPGLLGPPGAPPLEQRSAGEDLVPMAGAATTITNEDRVVELVNEQRLINGNLPPLKHHTLLDSSSETHSTNMAVRNFFGHCDLDTHTMPWDRMDAVGYPWISAAENIAAGYTTPDAVMAGWMASSGHRANILSTGSQEIGVGYVLQSGDAAGIRQDLDINCVADGPTGGPYFHYWTQNFGARFNGYPVVIEREAFETDQQTVDLYVYGSGWAQEMRFSNDHSTWSSWQTFNPNTMWTLSPGNGTKTVWAQIRNGSTVREASDAIELTGACTILQNQLELTGQTLGGTQTFQACLQILAHAGLHVSGNVTFRAGQSIVLGDGFSVGDGATFQAILQTP